MMKERELALMECEGFDERMKRVLSAVPFREFVVKLANGKTVRIDRANAVAFRSGGAAFIGPGKTIHLFNCEEVDEINDLPDP